MRPHAKFDEVMIVNPTEPNGGRVMRFYNGQPPAMGYYGYYGQPDYTYGQYDPGYGPIGYYAEDPYLSHQYPYGEVDPYGYGYGYYAEPQYPYGQYEPGYEPVGYYAAEDPYLAQDYPYGGVDPYNYGYYAEPPEMYGQYEPGYGQYEPVGHYAEEPYLAEDPYLSEEYPYGEVDPYGYYGEAPEMYGWGEPEISGYTRDLPPSFNAGCPLPTNVSGFGETEPLQGYVQPAEVSPSCSGFTPQPGPTASVPETFKPLW
jgi:hypothetical protein